MIDVTLETLLPFLLPTIAPSSTLFASNHETTETGKS
jgi:hypothetical protein